MFIGSTLKRDNSVARASSIHMPWSFSTTVVTLANNSGYAVCSVYRFILLENWHRVFQAYSEQDCNNMFVLSSCVRM
jgi:hypothetical protein